MTDAMRLGALMVAAPLVLIVCGVLLGLIGRWLSERH